MVLAQYRAAVAGRIISPTAMSVPKVLKAARRFSTKRSMNPCSTTQGLRVCDSKNTGSQVLTISGRNSTANEARVTVATPPKRSIEGSSMPRIEPNRKLWRGTAEPAADRIKMPAASAMR